VKEMTPFEQLLDFMRNMDRMKRSVASASTIVYTMEGFVLEHGRPWHAAPRPKAYRKMRDKQCFMNAQRLLARSWVRFRDADLESIVYCEGYAVGIIPVHHAWLVDRSGYVIDPTWREPERATYFGVPFKTAYVIGKVTQTKVWGSMLDNHEQGWPLLRGEDAAETAVDARWLPKR